jgi:CubicO group peptidase (beta-lactamase class C family)
MTRRQLLTSAPLALAAPLSPAPALAGGNPRTAIAGAAAYSGQHAEHALIIWQGGKTLLDRASPQLQQHRTHDVRSITKFFLALATLSAADRRIIDLDSPIAPLYTAFPTRSAAAQAITPRHLLTMSSGLPPAAAQIYRQGLQDLARTTLALTPAIAPGQAFQYGPSHYELLALFLSHRLQQASQANSWTIWLEEQLLKPAAIHPPSWRTDARGIPLASAAARCSPNSLLHLGRLILDEGRAPSAPRQQLIPTTTLRALRNGTATNPSFGPGLWLNHAARRPDAADPHTEDLLDAPPGTIPWHRHCVARSAPHDLITLLGSSGQRLYIVPSRQLVVVRLGQGKSFRDPPFWASLTP